MASAKLDQFRLDDSKIRRGDIALLLNTRGRPEKLVEVFNSLRQTTVQKDSVSLWLLVDDDDNLTRSAIDAGKFPDPGFPVHWQIGPSPQDWHTPFKALWELSGRTAEIYMLANDDVRFETNGWDRIVPDLRSVRARKTGTLRLKLSGNSPDVLRKSTCSQTTTFGLKPTAGTGLSAIERKSEPARLAHSV